MSLEKTLEDLARPAEPITTARLIRFSCLGADELKTFAKGWSVMPFERRRKILSMLVEMAEDNVELDFNVIFRHTLNDEDDEVRATAIGGLWECEERSVITPLIRLLQDDPNERVRATAAQALGRFAMLAETGKLLPRDATRVADALLGVIASEEETVEVRRRAVEAVAPMSLPRVTEVIQEALEDGDYKLRASALYAMGLNCDPRWLPVLMNELRDSSPELRYEAATALGELGEEDAVPDLVPLLHDPDAQVQAAVINALGSIGGPVAKAGLIQAIKESEDQRVTDLAEAALQLLEYEEEPLSFRVRGTRPG